MMMGQQMLQIRPIGEPDIPAVVALERESHFTPWTERNFRDAIAAGNLGLAGCSDGALVAMAILQIAAGEAELLTMAVRRDMRRRGCGRQLLNELIVRAVTYGASAMWLEVRVSNTPAIGLYRSAGFVDIGRRKDYYATAEGREDAMMMRRALGGAPHDAGDTKT
jgi:ribosomal-protein-alanine N-acetyltransferase